VARSSVHVSFCGTSVVPLVLVFPPNTTRRPPAASTTAALFARPLGPCPVVATWDQALAAKSKVQTSAYVVYVAPPGLERPPNGTARLAAGSSARACLARALGAAAPDASFCQAPQPTSRT